MKPRRGSTIRLAILSSGVSRFKVRILAVSGLLVLMLANSMSDRSIARTVNTPAPTPPPVAAPIQTWVFDGAFNASNAYGVAHTDSGLVAHILFPDNCISAPPGQSCPTPPPGESGYLLLSNPQIGVYVPSPSTPLSFGPEVDPSFPAPTTPPPFNPALVENDCEALQNEADVHNYIADLRAQLNAQVVQLEFCIQNMRQAACEALTTLECVRAKCAAEPGLCLGTLTADLVDSVDTGDGVDSWLQPCMECRAALLGMPFTVASAENTVRACQMVVDRLHAVNAFLQTILQGQAQPIDLERVSAGIKAIADSAEKRRQSMQSILSSFDEQRAACRHESLVASCALCPGNPGSFPPILPSGGVSVRVSARYLGRLSELFQAEARRTPDPALAARYASLARRLANLPASRVLEVSAPSDSPFSRQFLALRRADLPDDRRSPLAVVLTMVRSRGDCPPRLNLTDRAMLNGAFEIFRNTLDPGRPCPTCPR